MLKSRVKFARLLFNKITHSIKFTCMYFPDNTSCSPSRGNIKVYTDGNMYRPNVRKLRNAYEYSELLEHEITDS